jgi:hypothetical protein
MEALRVSKLSNTVWAFSFASSSLENKYSIRSTIRCCSASGGSAKGRSNDEPAAARQTYACKNGSYANFKNFNWKNNGWKMDENY